MSSFCIKSQLVEKCRTEAEKYLPVFRHCKHCRADSCGIPGKGKDLHSKLYDKEVVDTFSHG
jgi:nitrogen fixation protein NifB